MVLLNGREVAQKYGIQGIPTSFYIDARGRIVSSQEGAEDQAKMETRIKAILGRAP